MSGWVWLVSSDGLPHRVPDDASVIAGFVGRDFEVTDISGELNSDDEEFAVALAEWQAEQDVADALPAEGLETPTEADKSATNQEGNE